MSDSQPASQSSLNDSGFMTEIRAAEVAELFRHGIPGIIGALTGSIILTVGLWPSVPHDRLLIWLAAFLVSLIPRIVIGIRFWKIKPTGSQTEPWARLFAVGTFIGALFWASVPVFLFPDDNFLRQSLVTFVLAGLCGGIVVANAARQASQIPFILIVACGLVGRLAYEGDRDYLTMALLWVVFTAYLVTAARHMHLTITESLRLRFENRRHVEDLLFRNFQIESLNETLTEKVVALEKADEAIRLSKKVLEDRVRERTQDLARVVEELRAENADRFKAEEALRVSEERYRIHFENVKEVIFSYNNQLEIIDVTPSIEMTLGYSPGELVGKRFTEINVLETSSLLPAVEDARRVFGGESVDSRIYSFIHKDGSPRIGEVSGAPLMRDGQIIGVVSVARDITDRWRAEVALRASEEKYRSIIENIEEGYFEVDLKGNMVNFNDSACSILGYSREDLTGLNYRDYMDEENAKKVFETFTAVFNTRQGTKLSNWSIRRKDGTVRIVETPISLVYDSNSEPCGFRGLSRDVTARVRQEEALLKAYDDLELRVEERTRELKTTNNQLRLQIEEREKAEKELRDSERRYRLLADNVSDIIWTMDLNLRQTYCSPSVEEMRGFTVEEAVSHSLDQILAPSSYELAVKTFAQELPTLLGTDDDFSRSWSLELEMIRKDGSTIWTEMNMRPFLAPDGNLELMGVARDITRRRRDEEQLRESLREKEVLLREIHHRVKNNLQLIASMLELQAQSIGDKKTIEKIKEAQNRVWAMAAAHETLYQSGNLAEISSGIYLSRLLMYLASSMDSSTSQVELTEDLEDVPMKIDAAINCGLVLSELIANCHKHAFLNNADGKIEVSLKAVEENWIELAVRDNGVGIPDGMDFRNLKTFGLNLVSMLVQELRGEMCVKRVGGNEFSIVFPRTDTQES